MGKAKWRNNDYPLGYRMSGSTSSVVRVDNAENWYALALSVYEGFTSDDACRAMGVAALRPRKSKPQKPYTPKKGSMIWKFYEVVYILHVVCGVGHKDVSKIIGAEYGTCSSILAKGKEAIKGGTNINELFASHDSCRNAG